MDIWFPIRTAGGPICVCTKWETCLVGVAEPRSLGKHNRSSFITFWD